jgi:hypothetical protein
MVDQAILASLVGQVPNRPEVNAADRAVAVALEAAVAAKVAADPAVAADTAAPAPDEYALDGEAHHVFNVLRDRAIQPPDVIGSQVVSSFDAMAADPSLLTLEIAWRSAAAKGDATCQAFLKLWDQGLDWTSPLAAQCVAELAKAGHDLSASQLAQLQALSTTSTPAPKTSLLEQAGLTEADVSFDDIRALLASGKV